MNENRIVFGNWKDTSMQVLGPFKSIHMRDEALYGDDVHIASFSGTAWFLIDFECGNEGPFDTFFLTK